MMLIRSGLSILVGSIPAFILTMDVRLGANGSDLHQ